MSMIPTYRYSLSSSPPPMPFDRNNNDHQDQNHHHQPSSSSSNSLSYSLLFNQNQNQDQQRGTYSLEVEKFVPSSGSWNHHEEVELKDEKIWKKEEIGNECFEGDEDKWMPSKKRMIKRLMMEDRRSNFEHKFENLQEIENSSNNNNNNNMNIRVCSDCHTTKTPLWRSGPTGPKSLCNACGIRQRKARRALAAAAAAANGETLVAVEKPYVKVKKLQIKKKRTKNECAPPQQKLKRKGKIGKKCSSFEDLITSLSNNLAPHQVFPQDEKEAAILLMALSFDSYLDL